MWRAVFSGQRACGVATAFEDCYAQAMSLF
jgi:hypothetical protein